MFSSFVPTKIATGGLPDSLVPSITSWKFKFVVLKLYLRIVETLFDEVFQFQESLPAVFNLLIDRLFLSPRFYHWKSQNQCIDIHLKKLSGVKI